jgi:hypothetical protein
MEPIPTPSEMSVLLELIRIYMKEHYKHEPLTPEQLKQEAERMKEQLSKQAAGRVFNWESQEEREAALAKMEAYYKDKKEWNKLFQPRARKSAPKPL